MNYINVFVRAVFWLFSFLMLWKITYCENHILNNKISKNFISFVIPDRNEEKNLGKL
jgi:hypothetical protein